jgi:hypothetical protein
MNAPAPESGWTFGKVLAMAVALASMVGFGVCALCGVALTIEDMGSSSRAQIWQIALPFSAIGGASALALFFVVRAIVRSTRRKPADSDSTPPPNP